MPGTWETELGNDLEALGINCGPPEELLAWFRKWRLADDNRDTLTLDFLRRLADAAMHMTAKLFDNEVREDIEQYLAINTPASWLQIVGTIIAADPQDTIPSRRARMNTVQLIMATRAVPRDIKQLDKCKLSVMRTARFLAMWSEIYWEFASTKSTDEANELIHKQFSD